MVKCYLTLSAVTYDTWCISIQKFPILLNGSEKEKIFPNKYMSNDFVH